MNISSVLSFFKSGKNWLIMILSTVAVTLAGFYVTVQKDNNQKDERIAALTHKDYINKHKIKELRSLKAKEKKVEKEYSTAGTIKKEVVTYTKPEWFTNSLTNTEEEGTTQYADDRDSRPFRLGIGYDFYNQQVKIEGGITIERFYGGFNYPIIFDWNKCKLNRVYISVGVALPWRGI